MRAVDQAHTEFQGKPGEPAPTLSVVIPTFGVRSTTLLRRTLTSLSQEQRPPGLRGVFVVENGPRADAQAVCAEFAEGLRPVYLYSPITGVSHARNLGARHAKGEMLLFLDNDIRLSGTTLAAYASAFANFGTGCFFGGPVHIDYETAPAPELLPFMPDSVRGFALAPRQAQAVASNQRFLGANHAMPKWAFDRLDGFDLQGATGSNDGGIGEETRLQDRLFQIGLQGIYVPQAAVWHFVPAHACDLAWLKQRYVRYGKTEALLALAAEPVAPALLGVPRWLVRACIENLLLRLRLALCRAPRAAGIGAALDAQRLAGKVSVYRNRQRAG